ncbi:MAG TPA: hypothetical protein VN541_24070, partial [Tepidisphaeraceae bacterium]|nr:hypothetical protein [Tepidisphaeraceae bacterium]
MTFGKYVVVDVVSQGARGSLSTARPVGGGAGGAGAAGYATFAVKQFKLPQVDPDEPHWESQHFLDRARVQRSVVASGGRYWVAIHDMGMTEGGAWVVMDYLPLSAQKVIASRMELHVSELHHIVDSVVRGLVELQQVRRRAHGNLKPCNVLIASGSDLSGVPVLLSDPAQGISEGETGDLFALGNLIHQLVLHRPYGGPTQWPLKDEQAWKKLGKTGEQWRDLCSALLSPQAEARPSLYDLSHQMREMTPKKRKPSKANASISRKLQLKKRHLLAPAAVAGIVLGCLIVLALAVSSSRRQVAQAKAGWIDAFAAAVSNPERRARYRSDPDLSVALDDLDRSGLATLPAGGNPISDLTPSRLQMYRQAALAAHRLERELSPDHWHRVANVVALQQKYQTRGWNQAAGYLSDLVVAAQPRVGANVAAAIDRIFKVQPLIEKGQAQIEKNWAQIDSDARRLDMRNDRTLQTFARAIRSNVASSLTLADDGYHGIDRLAADAAIADRLDNATRSNWPGNIDSQRLAQDLSTKFDLANPTPQAMDAWLKNLPLYSIRSTENALAAAELRKRLKEVDTTLAREGQTDADRQGYQHDKKEAVAQVEAFAKDHFIEKEYEDGSFATRRDGLAAQIDLLRKYSRPQTPADLVKSLPSINVASQRIADYWDAWKKAQLTRQIKPAENRAQMASLKVQAQALQTTLTDVDHQFPPVPTDLSDEYKAVAQRHRDREIAKLLSGINPQSSRVDMLRLTSAAASYGDWCATLHKLAKDFPIRKSFITVDDRPDERWSLQDSFWNDPDIQQLVKGDRQRLAAVRALGNADRAALVKTARSNAPVEIEYEAWRQLGQSRIQPAWPATAQELAIESQVRTRLAGLLAKVSDQSDRQTCLGELQEQAPVRWAHAAGQADSEAALATVWQARNAFGIGAPQLDHLPAQ